MNLFSDINIITIIIILIFLMPITAGIVSPVSRDRIRQSLFSMVNSVKFILSLITAYYFVKVVFSDADNGFVRFLGSYAPTVKELISQYHHDIIAYLLVFFIAICMIFFVLDLLMIPFCRHVIVPLADKLSIAFNTKNPNIKRILSGFWQLPKSIYMVLIFSLLLNFYANYINNPYAGEYIHASKAYQAIHKNVLHPIFSADLVKKVPVLVSEAFRNAAVDFSPANSSSSADTNYWRLPAIKYFNGMTIDEAVKSNSQIDVAAKQIVGEENDERKKAYLLYKWISKNIEYDSAKAAIVLENPTSVKSGSIITFEERTGVCFDYSCLYVSMCRAAGLKVRLVSGLGYSGNEWGEHAWNQVYDPTEGRWINVDTTFGNSGNDYFDNSDFASSHKYEVIQGEWQK